MNHDQTRVRLEHGLIVEPKLLVGPGFGAFEPKLRGLEQAQKQVAARGLVQTQGDAQQIAPFLGLAHGGIAVADLGPLNMDDFGAEFRR